MKKNFLYLLITLSFLVSSTFAQNTTLKAVVEKETQTFQKPRPVHAGEYLERFYKATGFNPETAVPITPSLKKAAFNFTVGTPVTWKAQDFNTNSYYDVLSTCRVVGQNCYIFVEDAICGSSVNETGVTAVQQAFDSQTPTSSINPLKGIYQNNVDVFGNPPNVDGDPKIILLILDIKDTYDGQPGSGYIAGYFGSVNQYSRTQYSGSNEAEIYYLDGVQNNFTTEAGLVDAMSTTAHEFQHMIHFNYYYAQGKTPITFYNEMCSLSAEFINGYPLYSQTRYTNESNQWLEKWRSDNDVLTDYSRAAKLGRYLYEQFGTPLFTKFLANGTSGISGLNKALGEIGSTRRMADILPDWFMANLINNKSVNDKWGYNYQPLALMQQKVHNNPNTSYSGVINALAVEYISFTGGKNLTFNYNNNKNTSIKAIAFKYDKNNSISYDLIDANANYNVPEFGTSISKVTIAVYNVNTSPLNLSEAAKSNYSYTATGEFESSVQELAYDETEPTGYLKLTAGDSVAVIFSGVSGAKLDSIKVAVRNLVPVPGSVYEYKGLTSGFAGRKLASFTATPTISSSPDVIDSTGTYPYEQPYKNWVKVDLRSTSIPVDNSFTVIFPVEGVYPTKNRIMTTYYQSTSSYNSFWFSTSNDSWLYYRPEGKEGYIFLNLIRAYVSLVTDAKEVIELLPSSYSLEQNYPNPFNPSTIISYRLPKSGNVQIKIFDALGREVRSLINEEKNAGKHNILWDSRDNYGSKVSSGVYFYTITAGDFAETKKMVLLK